MDWINQCHRNNHGKHCDHWLNDSGRCCFCHVEDGPGGQEESPYTVRPLSNKELSGIQGSLDKSHGVGVSPDLYIAVERRLLATIDSDRELIRELIPLAADDPDGNLEEEGMTLIDHARDIANC